MKELILGQIDGKPFKIKLGDDHQFVLVVAEQDCNGVSALSHVHATKVGPLEGQVHPLVLGLSNKVLLDMSELMRRHNNLVDAMQYMIRLDVADMFTADDRNTFDNILARMSDTAWDTITKAAVYDPAEADRRIKAAHMSRKQEIQSKLEIMDKNRANLLDELSSLEREEEEAEHEQQMGS